MPLRCGIPQVREFDPYDNLVAKLKKDSSARSKVDSKVKQSTCKSKAFSPIDVQETGMNGDPDDNLNNFSDYQEIKLQELFKTLAPGLIPRSLCVIL